MPIKKKTTAAKKPAVLGPKAKLMKLAVTTLRNKAKKLGVSDVSKRTKENLVQSIIFGEARKKRGTAAGKKSTAKRTMSVCLPGAACMDGCSKEDYASRMTLVCVLFPQPLHHQQQQYHGGNQS